MHTLNKNIWALFYLIIIIASALLGVAVYNKYNEILNETKNDQLYLSHVFYNTLDSLFSQQEVIQNLIASEYISNDKFDGKILDVALTQNQHTVGIWIFSKDGDLLVTSSNLSTQKITNLSNHSNTRAWFQETLNSNQMVIGRAYFLTSLSRWILPLRKKIVNSAGETVAVISTGLDLAVLQNEWQKNNPHNIEATLENGHYRILRNNLTISQFKRFYNHPQKINKNLNLQRTSLKKSAKFSQKFASKDKQKYLYTFAYNKNYRFWVIASQPYQQVMKRLYSHSFFYTVFYLFLITSGFLLFRWIAKVENSKIDELTYKAEHDALTGLPNRTIIKRHFRQLQEKKKQPFALLYIDLDNFKNINDTFGHSYGDKILIEASKRISKSLTLHNGLVARYSGDEFVIFLEVGDRDIVKNYAERLLKSIALPYLINQNAFRISSSIGIARFPDDASHIETLLSYADSSMAMAKKKRNQYLFFSKQVHHQLMRNIEIEQALHHAIENDEISLVYQPQMDRDNKLFGVEALVRWHSKKLGFISPKQFIPIAEENGLMPKLGLYIMHKAMQEINNLQQQNNFSFKLSINVSVRQFIQIDFIEKLTEACKKFTSGQIEITIEITESLFIESVETLLPLFHKIKANYISLSLDDFGTGYSSLSMLRKIPIDELKIDKSFVDNISHNKQDRAMVNSIIGMGKSLGITVLAEGVETQEQLDILQLAGCDIYQGYHFSKPLSLDALTEFAQQHG
ncbi:bifunctional diguanylate cyclase/phosphodiesterase [Psychromonas hadalis]|uniref:bifunctional diguanylate cyclase/phosphodiesterase n=1 Tax=Psychromonas hadalis TaxID=211669 RepID=UPI0003B764E1|nr:EAL domain-containing protein [Psychromonas hadalis]